MYVLSTTGIVEHYTSLQEAMEAFPAERWVFDGVDTWVASYVDAIILVMREAKPVLH